MPVVKKIRVHLSKTAICYQFICLFPYKISKFPFLFVVDTKGNSEAPHTVPARRVPSCKTPLTIIFFYYLLDKGEILLIAGTAAY